MAQYKVPQDVEADDKLIGPFSFRQFVYLMVAGGLVALAVAFFQIFPLLAIIPLPIIFLLLALALPIKKDQPMETYLAALVSFYLKPQKRVWTPGQRESTILITAPKIVEEPKARDISSEEATHRLSFLADIVDTQGYAIQGMNTNLMRDDLVAEANATPDMFDSYQSQAISNAINQDKMERRQDAVREMREAINRNEGASYFNMMAGNGATKSSDAMRQTLNNAAANAQQNNSNSTQQNSGGTLQNSNAKTPTNAPKNSIIELANNSDYTVSTIAKEANRINRKEDGEIFVSLH